MAEQGTHFRDEGFDMGVSIEEGLELSVRDEKLRGIAFTIN